MATDRYIAALEISSSKVIGAIGAKGPSGQLEILAVEQEKSLDSVRYGHIGNIEETSALINYVLERLERRPGIAPREVTGVYVGLSGRSMRSIEREVSIDLPDNTEITDAILERLRRMALEAEFDNSLEVVEAVPRFYTVGGSVTHRPKGRLGSHISATYDLIVARPVIRANLRLVLSRLGLELKGIVVTQIALGDIMLNEHEKQLGCMLVDIGAETTAVTIYTKGNLVYYATLPLGGRNITIDLKSLNVIDTKAEELKLTFGHAIAPVVPSQEMVGPHRLSQISDYVVARAEEIAANIVEQMRYAGLSEKDIPEGIILCGGGARLNGMVEILGKFSGLKVRMAAFPSYIRMSDPAGAGMESLQVGVILYEGSQAADDDSCLQIPPPPAPEPEREKEKEPPVEVAPSKPEKGRNKSKFVDLFRRFFTPLGDEDDGEELT